MKRYIALFLILSTVLLAACYRADPQTTGGAQTQGQTTQAPVPTTTVPAPATTGAVDTKPWEAEPTFDPDTLLAQLSEDVKHQILADYRAANAELTTEELQLRVFGVFGEVYVLFVDGEAWGAMETEETVGGLRFCYSSTQYLLVYAGGHFYRLQNALDEKIITADELQTVFDNYYGAYPSRWAMYYGYYE